MKEIHYCFGRLWHSGRQPLWLALSAFFIAFALLWGHPVQAADGSISGTVTDGAGVGVPNISVELYVGIDEWFGLSWQVTRVEQATGSGAYSFAGLTAGTYRIGFVDSNYPATFIEEYYNNARNVEEATDIPLADGENKTGINGQLVEFGKIAGKVTGPDGNPIDFIPITAYRTEFDRWNEFVTVYASSDGTYVIPRLDTGTYRVLFGDMYDTSASYAFEFYENAIDVDSATDIAVTAGETTGEINAQLSELGKITGTVTDASGAPIENVAVKAFVDSFGFWRDGTTVYTLADGTYELSGLTTGSYRVRFEAASEGGASYMTEYYDNANNLGAATDISVAAETTVSGINAQLTESTTLQGTVTDGAGNPLPDIQVTLYFESECCPDFLEGVATVLTDENGAYTLPVRQLGAYRVGFRDPNGIYPAIYYPNVTDLDVATDIFVETAVAVSGIDVQMTKFATISGAVTDLSGNPLDGVGVEVYRSNGGPCCGYLDRVAYGSTNSDGTYIVGQLQAGTYRVRFLNMDAGFQTEVYNDASTLLTGTDIEVGEGESVEGIDAQLSPLSSISGTVTDVEGNPLPLIEVLSFHWNTTTVDGNFYDSVLTDENGQYTISQIDKGHYQISFSDATGTYLSQSYNNGSPSEDFTELIIENGDPITGIDAQMIKSGEASLASISGNVTDSSGNPLSSIQVILHQWVPEGGYANIFSRLWSDANGQYIFGGLEAGIYYLEYQDSQKLYQSEFFDNVGTLESATAISVGSGEAISGINVQLANLSSISGTVIDERGNPIPNVFVQSYLVETNGTFTRNSAMTDQAGKYTIVGLGTGAYQISFSPSDSPYSFEYYDNKPLFEVATNINVGESEAVVGIDATLSLAGKIAGTVTDSSGTPLEQISVIAYILTGDSPESSDAWQIYEDRYTDEMGQYNLYSIFPGTYRIKFGFEFSDEYSFEYYENATTLESATDIHVAAGQTVTIDAQLTHVTGVNGISGQVTDGSGNNLPNIDVGVYQKNAASINRLETWDLVKSAVTGFDGHYEIRSLAPGSYRVGFSNGESLYHSEFYSNSYYLGDAQDIPVGEDGYAENIDAQLEGISLNVKPKGRHDRMLIAEASSSSVLDDQTNSLLANDEDAEGKTLTATLVDLPEHGTLILKVDGTFSYVHDGSETTEDRFTYMASDGVNMSELVTVTIVITPVNDAPVAVADALTVDQGGIATALTSGSSVLGNDSDAEGAALTAAVVEQPKHGTLILNPDGTFTYVHDGSQNLVDSFSYKVSDGTAESDAVQVSVQVNEPEGTNLPDDQFLYFPLIN